MKKFKSNNRILTYLICFSLLAFLNIGCETENEIEEILGASENIEVLAKKDKTHKVAESNRAFAHFGRRRTKPKRFVFTVITTNSESINDLRYVAVEIEKKEGFINETKTYLLSLKKETKIDKIFTSDDIIIENDEIIGEELNVNITFLDGNKKPIEESSSRIITVSDQKANYIRTTSEIKQRTNGLYRASIVVNDDNKNEVSTIALEIEKKEGVLNETKTYYLDYYTTVKKDKYFTFADIKLDGKDLENQEVVTNITLLDANKKAISTSTGTTTIAGLSKANIKRTRLKKRRNGLYKMSAAIENDDDNEVAAIAVKVNDLQGNTATFNTTPKKKNTITTSFSFEKASTSQKMSVTYVLKDFYGDEISTTKEEVSLESDIIKKPALTQNKDGKTFSLNIPLMRKGLGKYLKNLKIKVNLKPINGGSEAKQFTDGASFSFLEVTKGIVIYENNSITFMKPNNVIGKQYAVQITIADANGEELDYAEFRIVGLE